MVHIADIVDRSDGFLVAEAVELSWGFDFVGVLFPFLCLCRDVLLPCAFPETYVV